MALRISIQAKLSIQNKLQLVANERGREGNTYLRPIHARGPVEKGRKCSRSSAESLSSHLSGRKTVGSSKMEGFDISPIVGMLTIV